MKALLDNGAHPDGGAAFDQTRFNSFTVGEKGDPRRPVVWNSTPLEMAVDSGAEARFQLVTLLLEHGATPHRGLLVCAAQNGALDVAQLLVAEHGANPNETMIVDMNEGLVGSPLQCAAEKGHGGILRFLLEENANPDQATHSFSTSWRNNGVARVRTIALDDADGFTDRQTPLLLAIACKEASAEMMVVTLLQRNANPNLASANANARRDAGFT